jgi:hypothetical protein
VRNDWTLQVREKGFSLYTRLERGVWLYMVRDDFRKVYYLGTNELYAMSFVS